jgi:hypothetical protein
MLYRNDQMGYGSDNTGFFFLFKQGVLQNQDFNLAEAITNRTVNINIEGCNEEDHWLYKLDDVGSVASEWLYVESVYAAAVEQLAPNPSGPYAANWREAVRQHHAKKNAKAKAKREARATLARFISSHFQIVHIHG